jgi:hypothetical protein
MYQSQEWIVTERFNAEKHFYGSQRKAAHRWARRAARIFQQLEKR